jgi:ectoine hydroxylase-related dioxygenase (phytanoyl-CoA dioxygenase family)
MNNGNLRVSYDTDVYEIRDWQTADGALSATAAREICRTIDVHGFALLSDVLSGEESDKLRQEVDGIVSAPSREVASFASQTDSQFRRRNFVALPMSPEILQAAQKLTKRLCKVLSQYTGTSRSLLEVSALISYFGSSHQYLHRDPPGVISIFVALNDIAPGQGGTLFVPDSHQYCGSNEKHGGKADTWLELFRTATNWRVLCHNFKKVWSMRSNNQLAPGEFSARTFSNAKDDHQPNLWRFLTARNYHFDIGKLTPVFFLQWLRYRGDIEKEYRLVQLKLRKGSVVVYRSDVLHAGPDNQSSNPRIYFSLSFARDTMGDQIRRSGYTAHPSLLSNPRTLGDLLDS